jgi:hypothetical protein
VGRGTAIVVCRRLANRYRRSYVNRPRSFSCNKHALEQRLDVVLEDLAVLKRSAARIASHRAKQFGALHEVPTEDGTRPWAASRENFLEANAVSGNNFATAV